MYQKSPLISNLYENFIDKWILKGTYNALKCLRTQDTLKPLSTFVELENLAALVNPVKVQIVYKTL